MLITLLRAWGAISIVIINVRLFLITLFVGFLEEPLQ